MHHCELYVCVLRLFWWRRAVVRSCETETALCHLVIGTARYMCHLWTWRLTCYFATITTAFNIHHRLAQLPRSLCVASLLRKPSLSISRELHKTSRHIRVFLWKYRKFRKKNRCCYWLFKPFETLKICALLDNFCVNLGLGVRPRPPAPPSLARAVRGMRLINGLQTVSKIIHNFISP